MLIHSLCKSTCIYIYVCSCLGVQFESCTAWQKMQLTPNEVREQLDNISNLTQFLESDTVLLIFKNLYPHQACITETLNISRIHPRNLGLNQDLHESHLGNIWYSCGIHMGSIWDPHGKYMGPTWERHGSHNESQINPVWDPFKTHFHSLCGYHMGNPYGAYIPAHMDPIWDLYTHVVWVVLPVITITKMV